MRYLREYCNTDGERQEEKERKKERKKEKERGGEERVLHSREVTVVR